MKLGKTEPVCILDYQRVDIRHINTGFNNRCTNKYINITLKQVTPNVAQLILGHLSVSNGNICIREKIPEL